MIRLEKCRPGWTSANSMQEVQVEGVMWALVVEVQRELTARWRGEAATQEEGRSCS